MKSKILILGAFILGALFMKVSAQSINNIYSIQPYTGPTNSSYMMGTVSIPSVGAPVVNPPQTSVPPTNVVQPGQACVSFINTFNKYGSHNQDVAKLQQFLNHFNGAKLNGLGFYGPATMQEVKNLQYAYGINPTGAQYEKTTQLINAINCGQVQPKARVIYTGGNVGYVTKPTVSPAGNVTTGNIYPNPGPNGAPVPTKSTDTGNVTRVTPGAKATPTTTTSSSTSIAGSLGTDFDAIKENYKAYVLVLVLIAALFWFLRKAATE